MFESCRARQGTRVTFSACRHPTIGWSRRSSAPRSTVEPSLAAPLYLAERREEQIVVELLQDGAAEIRGVTLILISSDGDPGELVRRAAFDHFARNPDHTRVLVSTVSGAQGW